VLSRVSEQQQLEELTESKRVLEEQLGPIHTFAYPVGSREAFTPATQRAAKAAGYRAAFSYYGGFNGTTPPDPFDVRRQGISETIPERFQLQTTLAGISGAYWF
jgi:hypothetical protein